MGTVVYIYGPPAVGKLTVASSLQQQTGFRLFHNHLTVNALVSVLDRESPAFTEVLQRLRLDVFETAARNNIDLVFTHNSVRADDEGRKRFAAFADSVRDAVESAHGRVVFVQLTAPPDVLRARVSNDSRRAYGKLLDPERLSARLEGHDPRPLHGDDLVINTALVEPTEAAGEIVRHLGRTS